MSFHIAFVHKRHTLECLKELEGENVNASNFCCVIDSILVQEILNSLTISAYNRDCCALLQENLCSFCPISLGALFLEPESSTLHQTCVQTDRAGEIPPPI